MAKRPVSAQELATVASRFNGTPVADNPREFDFPDAAASDAWNKAVDRLEAGETLDAVLGKSDSHVASDVARGFVGGAARQVLDPAVDASRALLPSGWGVEAAVERLGGGKQALTESDLYKKATYVPETKAGTLGSYLPVAAGIATGIAAEGVIPTAVTLGGAIAGEKTARGVTDVLASDPRFNLTPEQLKAWKNMAGTVGMIAGGGYAHGKAPKVTIPEAIAAGKQRAYGAVLGGVKGYQLGGIPTGMLGSIAGVVNPETVALADKPAIMRMLKKGALGPQAETEAKVNDLMEVYGPTGVAGRVDLVTDATSKKDYAAVQRHLASYVNAGKQPPAALVELFDRLREHRIASNKSVSAEAYDVATAQLVDAAAQGPQAYKQALAAIPKQTRALLQNVDASLLSTLESRAKNAGGRVGKPADDPWFTLMKDSATSRAAKRGKSELGYSPQLPRQHDATTLSAAARLLQLAHDFTAIREATPQLLKSVVKNPEIDARLAEFERLSRLFAGQGKVSSFATTREDIPNIGTVNSWIANSTNLTPRIKEALGVTVAKD